MSLFTEGGIILSLIIGVICYLWAKEKNLPNPLLWLFGGAVFSIFTLAIIAFIKKKVKKPVS